MKELKREFELKLSLTKDEFERLARGSKFAGIAVSRSQKTLRSIYYDTSDNQLRGKGIALRVRHNGNGYIQTVKADTALRDGLSNPIEIEAHLDGATPDLDRIGDKRMRRKLIRTLDGLPLAPSFETVVNRITHRLRQGDSAMELALDEGEVRAGGRKSEIREAELELISGNPKDLLDMAQTLFSKSNARLSPVSKAERGYRLLLDEHRDYKAEPVHAGKPDVRQGQTCGQAFAEILHSAREQIAKNQIAVLETDDAEGAHQLRIGLTRLRSALRALKPMLDSQPLGEFDAHAKTISRSVGQLRDADVLIEDIFAPVANGSPAKPGFDELRQTLQEHRAAMRDGARQALVSEEWAKLLLSLTLWPAMLERDENLKQPVEDLARAALQKRWKKLSKMGRSLESLDQAQKHKMRRSLKKLRYMVEFFSPLYGQKEVKRFVKDLKKLQTIFGYLNDVKTADHLRVICAGRRGSDPDCCIAAGYVLGRHEAHFDQIWNGAIKRWNGLQAAGLFWD